MAAPWHAARAALLDQLLRHAVGVDWLLGRAAHRAVQPAGPPQQSAQCRTLLEAAALRTVCLASLLLALWTVWRAQTWQTAAGAIQLTGGAVHWAVHQARRLAKAWPAAWVTSGAQIRQVTARAWWLACGAVHMATHETGMLADLLRVAKAVWRAGLPWHAAWRSQPSCGTVHIPRGAVLRRADVMPMLGGPWRTMAVCVRVQTWRQGTWTV